MIYFFLLNLYKVIEPVRNKEILQPRIELYIQ